MENLGLVGLSDAGANRLFRALTGLPEPGLFDTAVGIAHVPDERVDRLGEMSRSKKLVYPGFELVHIALPPGAKPGEGLGARFLGSLRDCDAILFVLRAHETPGSGPADPEGDLAAIQLELVLADHKTVEGRLDRQRRAARGDKSLADEITALERALSALEGGTPICDSDLTPAERELLGPCFLLTVKPALVVLNVADDQLDGAPTASFGDDALAACVDVEAEIAASAPGERAELLEAFGIGESVLPRLARAALHLLGRHTFLTTGEDESRAWTFRSGARAPECAGVIHSDLQRGFIRAEVVNWSELLEIGSWSRAKELGKIRVEGKDYEVADGDVLEIRFNV
ncbi:MAG: YchF family ATPase [Acidimicrobiia bacterium]|nr:YchF family ATPase [Acidimicrobiia bacterium]